MTSPLRRLGLGLAIWLTALAPMSASVAFAAGHAAAAGTPAGPPAEPAASGPDARPSERQLLVLLRLPPAHFRPNTQYSGAYGDGEGRAARHRIAGALAAANGLTLVDDWPMPLVGVDCFIMNAPVGRSPSEAAARLSRDPRVAWAEPVSLYRAQGDTPKGDTPTGGAWKGDVGKSEAGAGRLFRAQPAALEWRLADLHQMASGRDVRVAVIDSAIERSHPDLIGQVQISEDFVQGHPAGPEQHGTGVAGIIAAKGVGIVGVAPRARLMALRACWQRGAGEAGPSTTVCDSLSLAKALHFAVEHNAQVINLSLSGPPDPLLGKLIDVALARGVTVVGAFDRTLPGGGFPVSHSGVVAVAAESMDAPPAGIYSAPGRDVPTTQPGARWYLVDGSSYAAAHVSGLIALVRERAPRSRGASALVAAPAGGGAIDACATLLKAFGPCDCACARGLKTSATVRR